MGLVPMSPNTTPSAPMKTARQASRRRSPTRSACSGSARRLRPARVGTSRKPAICRRATGCARTGCSARRPPRRRPARVAQDVGGAVHLAVEEVRVVPHGTGADHGDPRARRTARERRLRRMSMTSTPGPVPDGRRSPDPLRRQRRLAGAGDPAHQPLAGERLRVHADVGHACRARPPVRHRPAGVRRIRTPRRPPVPASDGRVPGPAHRRGRSGHAPHRRARRRDLGRPVRGGGASGADRKRDRGHGRSCGPAPAR